MKNSELQIRLLEGLGRKLSAFGFGEKARQQTFYRPIDGGWACTHISFINHSNDFDVTVDIGIRFDNVENLINNNNKFLTNKEKKETSTLGIELGNLVEGEQRRWNVTSCGQMVSTIKSIVDVYAKYGEPYLQKYSTIDTAYELLSSDESCVWKHSPFHATRAKKAIAIAKLLELPNIQNLILSRRNFLEEINDFGLSDFEEFVRLIS